jgi:hypothetical protein
MIQFHCRCKHLFEVADDEAGGLVQCPECGLLRDVPSPSDLKVLDDQGLYKLDETPQKEEGRLAELGHIFQRGNVDEEGNEIDLRSTLQNIRSADEDAPLELADEVRPEAPKYDPETGELIRPLELKGDSEIKAPQQPIPVGTPALSYASKFTNPQTVEVNPVTLIALLFSPMNIVVMFFILLAHLFTQFTVFAAAARFLLMVPLAFILNLLIFSHYACVVEETGPDERDELPRPLRHLDWHEDLWGPLMKFAVAGLYSFSPLAFSAVMGIPIDIRPIIMLTMAILGCIIFPAALLTSVTSGTYLNLRPDRVIDIIRICGWKYVLAVVIFAAICVVYPLGQAAIFDRAISIFSPSGSGKPYLWFGAYGLLVAGVVMMHYFCWLLGLLYRGHHDEFPWLFQRHNLNPMERMAWEATRRAERQQRQEIRRRQV